MSDIDARIDELYQGPLDQFVASRNALARTLKGAVAQRVRALQKPTVVAWAANQVYWHARVLYDRLMQCGQKLRSAQIAALEGRPADLQGATKAHRDALAKATGRAVQIAAVAGAHPSPEEIGRTFEALSIARTDPDYPGRITTALAPAGFEALGGIVVLGAPDRREVAPVRPTGASLRDGRPGERAAVGREQRARERKAAEAERQRRATLKKAESAVARAAAEEARSRKSWEKAKRALADAERALAALA